jgi:BirA family transcriptional regulator, biotin operon repressor / biotin---[acetyl-CoA-carboxylase] ligase
MTAPTHAPQRSIDRARLAAGLPLACQSWPLEIVDTTGSTNTDLNQRLRASRVLNEALVRVAYQQSAGRGRRGRPWLAAAGDALMFSLAYPIRRPLAELAGLSLAVGTAILAGLRTVPGLAAAPLALKWPNDILLDGAKLGGVLIETVWSDTGGSAVVIGIGLNLYGAQALAEELAARATPGAPLNAIASLDQVLAQPDITTILAALLSALAEMLTRFEQQGFAAFRAAWLADHAYAGQAVVLLENGQEIARGTADSIDQQGLLQITAADGTLHSCAVGDVSLRLRAGADPAGSPADAAPQTAAGVQH